MTPTDESTRRAVWIAVFVAVVVVAQSVGARALRDGFFLSEFAASRLPLMILCGATLSVTGVLGTTHWLRETPPAKSVPWLFTASALMFALEWVLSLYEPGIAAVTMYLHVMSLVALVASGFWSVVSERFDPHTAKQSIGLIGGGATLGGVLGGAAAWWGASRLDVSSMILALSILNLGCALGVQRLGAGSRPVLGRSSQTAAGVTILRETPYLRHLGSLVVAAAFCQAVYDIAFKSVVAERYAQGSELVSFFALFYMGLNIATFLLQNLLTHRLLKTYGLSFTVGTLPGSGLLLGLIALAFPGLGSAIAMRGGIGAIENSTFRSGYELLYTPVLPQKKRPTKSLIDVAGEMSGAILGGGFAVLVVAVVPNVSNTILITAGILASLTGMYITRKIRAGYVKSLEDSLEAGHIDLEEAAFGTAQTAEADTVDSILERPVANRLMRSSLGEFLRQRRAGRASEERLRWRYAPLERDQSSYGTGGNPDSRATALLQLLSNDPTAVRRALSEQSPLPGEWIGLVPPLLENTEVEADAMRALRRVAPAHVGFLLDSLRAARYTRKVRLRICDLLGEIPVQRCADGLVDYLAIDDWELRFRAASSLLRIKRANSLLEVPRHGVFEAIRAEAQHCRRLWSAQAALDSRISNTALLESPAGRRVVQGVTYIFTLLLTVLDQQPTILAARALAQTTGAQRGTGLEYLENVLPEHVLRELRPLMLDVRLALGRVFTRSEILADICTSNLSPQEEMAQLRRHVEAMHSFRSTNKA